MPTKIADIAVPVLWERYLTVNTEDPSRLIRSGAVRMDGTMNQWLQGGGMTENIPYWDDLPNDAENTSTDDDTSKASPKKIGTLVEQAVRVSRNQAWSAMDLASELAGDDAMAAIGSRVSKYWQRREEQMLAAIIQGVFADNAAAPDASEHVIDDLTHDISGTSFENGVTTFSIAAVIDALAQFNDTDEPGLILMHPIVYARAQKNNLIDTIPDSEGRLTINRIPALNKEVIKTRAVPSESGAGPLSVGAGLYHTWILGAGAIRFGQANAKVPVEAEREALAGDGGGQDILVTRIVRSYHPTGHTFAGTVTNGGGPTNAATPNNFAHAGSWKRVYPEREQIKIVRLITRENANT